MATRRRRSSIELEDQNGTSLSDLPNGEATQQPSEVGSIASLRSPGDGIEQQLERADGGAAAWKILIASFMFEGVLFGFSVSFGVFQDYYTRLSEFKGSSYVPVVGTLASGIPYLGGPVMAVIVRWYLCYRQPMMWIGWLLCILGLIAGSFANSLGPLIVTQGIMYGIGFLILTFPVYSIVNEWWIARRGMAFGIITSAAGVSGIGMPLIIEVIVNKYGYRTALRAIAIAMVVLTGPLIALMKGRLPPSPASSVARTDWSFAKKPLFFVYCLANMTQGLGFFFPSLFLPSYATSIGLSPGQGAMLLSLMSVAQVLGQWTFGILSDKVGLNILVLFSTLATALASFTSWGLAHDLVPLIIFSLLFGFFAYGFSSMRARMGTAVSEEPTAALATFGFFTFSQGLGNVLAGPISAGLLSGGVMKDSYGIVRYKSLIIFTGSCMLLSAMSVGSWYIRPFRARTR